jgi:hypothetical protein
MKLKKNLVLINFGDLLVDLEFIRTLLDSVGLQWEIRYRYGVIRTQKAN